MFVQRLSEARVAAEILLWRHGWSWLAAVLLGCAALALHLGALSPARTRLALASSALSRVVTQPPAPASSPRSTEEQQLRALQQSLSGPADAAALIRRLAALAGEAQIALAQSEYQQQLHASAQVVQIQVTQPVRASYPQLKRYVQSVLRAIPNASLDQISARRENVGQAELEARLVWSLWMHLPSAAKTGVAPRLETP